VSEKGQDYWATCGHITVWDLTKEPQGVASLEIPAFVTASLSNFEDLIRVFKITRQFE